MALREHSLVVHLDDETVLRFDLEGRWFSASLGSTVHRRALDHRVLASPRATRGARAAAGTWLAPDAAHTLSSRVHDLARQAAEELTEGTLPLLDGSATEPTALALARTSVWTEHRYASHAELFRRTYGSIPVLPPDQYLALVVQVVQGCSYNRCSFCTLYRDVPYRVRSGDELDEHLGHIGELLGRAMTMRRGVFLADANALALSTAQLEDRLHRIAGFLTEHGHGAVARAGVAAFQDSFTRTHRSVHEYRALRAAGLRRVYLGLESGDDATRALIDKPGRAAEVSAFLTDLKASGLSVGLMVLVGVGGRRMAAAHLENTVRFLGEQALDRQDRIFLSSLSAGPGSPYAERMQSEGIEPLTEAEVAAQAEAFREALRTADGPVVGRYRLDDFVPY